MLLCEWCKLADFIDESTKYKEGMELGEEGT
jgi:hypothetical protein